MTLEQEKIDLWNIINDYIAPDGSEIELKNEDELLAEDNGKITCNTVCGFQTISLNREFYYTGGDKFESLANFIYIIKTPSGRLLQVIYRQNWRDDWALPDTPEEIKEVKEKYKTVAYYEEI
jgi:hypothetical protein